MQLSLRKIGMRVVGIVGKSDGFTRKVADASILVPIVNPEYITPHSESSK